MVAVNDSPTPGAAKHMMSVIQWLVVGAALVWVALVLMGTYYELHRGEGIVSTPLFASTLMFALGMGVLWLLGASPLHLLWWFPLSAVLGVVLLMVSSTWTSFNMRCLSWLASIKPQDDSDPEQ